MALVFVAGSLNAATITVNSITDTAANDGACTLREAITSSNTNLASGALPGECGAGAAGADIIAFNIGAAGVLRTISLSAVLPTITETVAIAGYTQPGSSVNTLALNAGDNAVLLIEVTGAPGNCLNVAAASSVVRGLVIHGCDDGINVNANSVTIAGNFIGTNATGTAAAPSTTRGIRVAGGNNTVIGGAAAADRNLLSGSSPDQVSIQGGAGAIIQNNYIGTYAAGTSSATGSIGTRGVNVISPASSTSVIGNLISGIETGIFLFSGTGATVLGNLIGTQRDGVTALPNSVGIQSGVFSAIIGGTTPGEGNIIAFNTAYGVRVVDNVTGNGILGNSIHSNTFLGITLTPSVSVPLANDACDVDVVPGNAGQNYPVLTTVAVVGGTAAVSGTLNSTANTTFQIDFFSNASCDASGNGEGRTFLGSTNVTTDASCTATFGLLGFPGVPAGETIITATATDPANNTSEFSACFAAVVIADADLSVTKSDSPDPVTAGNNITYTIGVTNGGPSAASTATLNDTVPTNTTFVSFTAPAGWTSSTPAVGGTGTVTAVNPSLANGASAAFTLVVRVNPGTASGTVVSNTASVSSQNPDANSGNNAATVTTTVAVGADVGVTKTGNLASVSPGGQISWTIVVSNSGPSTATNVVLTDVLPANTTFVSFTAPAGWTPSSPAVGSPGTVTASNPSLAPGASATFTLVAAVSAAAPNGTLITNVASVSTSTADGNSANDRATFTSTVVVAAAAAANVPFLGGNGLIARGRRV